MQKTKLGITIGLAGAILFFFGLINTTAAVLLAGYVLLAEENAWLKRTAIKAVVTFIAFALIGVGIDVLQELVGMIGVLANHTLIIPSKILNIVNYIYMIVEKCSLAWMGFRALSLRNVRIPFVDDCVNKNT